MSVVIACSTVEWKQVVHCTASMTPQQLLTEEQENLEQVTELDISHLVIEDDTPVDKI